MAIIKKYNTDSEEWEAILVGKQGPPGTAAIVNTTSITDGTYTLLESDIGTLLVFDGSGCTITIPDDLGNDYTDFEIYLHRQDATGELDIALGGLVTQQGIDPTSVPAGGTFAVKKLGANNQFLLI